MARRASDVPTEAELEILQVLWSRGPCTVRQVNQAVNALRPTGYTTTLKLMQIMLAKGRVKRDASRRPQVYEPAVAREHAQREMVGDLLKRLFEGSASQFVQQVLSAGPASPKEMTEIRRLLRQYGKES